MIPGVTELTKVFNVLKLLEVVEEGMDIANAANYAMAYSPKKIYMEESSGPGEEFEVTPEEAEIIFICDHGVDAWFEKMDRILLGGDDED